MSSSGSELTNDTALTPDGRQSDVAASVQRGVSRLLAQMGYAPLTELTLKTGRRVDVVAVNDKSEIIVVEIKSSVTDFRCDRKWHEYLEFCDQFYFAVPLDFPVEILPDSIGMIVADQYGGDIVREAEPARLSAARRKMVMVLFARAAATRVHRNLDPHL